MNAFDSMVYDSSADAGANARRRVRRSPWPESACCRLDACPCEPDVLAEMILSPRNGNTGCPCARSRSAASEWLLGRCVAKEAVRSLLENRIHAVARRNRDRARPLRPPAGAASGAGPMARAGLSSRHLHRPQPGHRRSACSASIRKPVVGIDLESLTSPPRRFRSHRLQSG